MLTKFDSKLINQTAKSILRFDKYRYLSTSFTKTVYKSTLLKSNPLLLPQLSFTSQLKTNLLRTFSTNVTNLSYYRAPKSSIYNSGIISKVWSRIPDSVKLLGLVGVSAYLVVFVALPIAIMVIPPIIIGSWLFVKFNKYFKQKTLKRTWDSISDSTLIYYPKIENTKLFVQSPDQINSNLANFEINRLLDAFWSNEQNIYDYFRIDDIDNLALGTLDAVEYNYNSTSVLFADDFSMLVTQQRSLYDKSKQKEIANVILSLKCLTAPVFEDIDPSANIGKSLVQIEVIPNTLFAKSFVFKTPSVSTTKTDAMDDDNNNQDDDGYINVKGKTTVL